MPNVRRITFREISHNVLGLDSIHEGRLRLRNWNGVASDKLPLAALGDDILAYIDANGGGGGDVANADNIRGSVAVTTTTETTVASKAGDDVWKLRGFACWGNLDTDPSLADDATITLYIDSTVAYRARVDDFTTGVVFVMPNPEVIASGSTVYVKAKRTDIGEGNMTYYVTIFGE